jgi:hypothetical protein
MRYRAFCLIFALILATTSARAQVTSTCEKSIIDPTVAGLASALQSANALTDANSKQAAIASAKRRFRDALRNGTMLGGCLSNLDDKAFAGILEVRRIDKQIGASNGGAGSTNLVPSGSVPALFGLAMEYGGLTESFSGTTATFRTTPAKLIGAMLNLYGPNAKPPSDRTLLALEHLSLSVSFDTSRTASANTDSGTTLLANYQQLSQITARYIIINDRDPLAAKNWRKIRNLSLADSSVNVANAGRDLVAPLSNLQGYDDALTKAGNSFDAVASDPSEDSLKKILVTYVQDLQLLTALIPDWQERARAYRDARIKLDAQHSELYRQIAKAPSLSLEYDLNRPPLVSASGTTTLPTPSAGSPDLSTISLVYVASLFSSEYTLNANVNFFNEARTDMKGNFRDFQIAGKWDIPVGHIPTFLAKGTLTFSGLFEHLHQKPLGVGLTINDVAVNQPGNMGIFQAKYSIPMGDSGIQIPISFTASNRTELIKERDIRGNVGITFDLDKLLAKK